MAVAQQSAGEADDDLQHRLSAIGFVLHDVGRLMRKRFEQQAAHMEPGGVAGDGGDHPLGGIGRAVG